MDAGKVDGKARLRRRLLAWYDGNGRDGLPWRAPPGAVADPYRVWVSEIMLQQTTIAAVIPYFTRFIGRWPTVSALARAPLDDVLHAWQGLGYYARARNLHAAARLIDSQGGRLPETAAALRLLPGIGAYTAAAIAAIAFAAAVVPVDSNAARVLARVYGLAPPAAPARMAELAAGLAASERPGDFAQALMDLGATICLPRRPRCDACPWREDCTVGAAGGPEALPAPPPPRVRPLRHGVAFWAALPNGSILVRRRPPDGLLGGLMEVPSTEWRRTPWTEVEAVTAAPLPLAWQPLDGRVRHVFTHFALELMVFRGMAPPLAATEGLWVAPSRLPELAMPTLMRKVVRLAGGAAGELSGHRRRAS